MAMEQLLNFDFNSFGTLLMLYLSLFAIIFVRYVIVSGAYYYVFLVLFKKKYEKKILIKKEPDLPQLKREVFLSVYSAMIFGFFGLLLLVLWYNGLTKIYVELSQYSLWYIPLSILIFLVLHDTYYYWLHRLMHRFKWLRSFHMVHHKSVNTTVLTAFSFHPVESFFQALILPVLFMFIPMHIGAVSIVLITMTISATINHAGVEVYPKKSRIFSFTKYIIGATHHDIHHRHVKKNLGLYFTFWDRMMKTENTNI